MVVVERLTVGPNAARKTKRTRHGGIEKVTNEAFADIKIDHLLKANGWHPTDDLGVRFEYPLDDDG